MANDQQQCGNEPQQQQLLPPELPAKGIKRRRLAKAGLGAAGVLWSLESHATLNVKCATPSAYGSAGLNSSNRTEQTCNPLSPSNWCFVQNRWPCNKAKLFSEVFACHGERFATTYGKDSLLAVMNYARYDDFQLGRHLATAYLNVMSGRVPTLDVATVQRMWKELMNGGLFKVGANQHWTAIDVRNYLVAIHGK